MLYHTIPIPTIYEYLKEASDNFTIPIVSVGSGNGALEFEIVMMIQKTDIDLILVDPTPESYQKYPENRRCLTPDYPTVEDLIKTEPRLINNCVLFLGWPSPNNSTYDVDAINSLRPLRVVALYEKEEGAGGEFFHNWVRNMRMKKRLQTNPNMCYYLADDIVKDEYVLSQEFSKDVTADVPWYKKDIIGHSTSVLSTFSLL